MGADKIKKKTKYTILNTLILLTLILFNSLMLTLFGCHLFFVVEGGVTSIIKSYLVRKLN